MNELYTIGWLFALGVITALHPCPFTTIGIVSGLFISLGRSSVRIVVFALGIICAFALVGGIACTSISLIPAASHVLSIIFKPFLGPVLIIAGMLQCGLIRLSDRWKIKMGNAWERAGLAGCFLGGVFIALAFCPATAGIFFILVIPASVNADIPFLFPAVYGLGFALVPVGLMAALKVFSLKLSGRFSRMATLSASSLLIVGGVYISIRYTYGLG